MKIQAYKIIFLFLLFSCGASEQEKLSDEIDKILAEVELSAKNRRDSIENLKFNIFNQPDSVYISESYRVYINNFFDSLFRSSCYGQSFVTDEGFVVMNNHLSNGTDEVIRYVDYDDTSRSSLSYNKFNKLVHHNNDLNILTKKTQEIFATRYGGWDDVVRIIPVKLKLDSTVLNLIKKDKNLPFYFKQSILKNIPIFLLLRSKETKYKGNNFKDAGLDKDQVGKTYHYGEYEESGKVLSVSFMYLEPLKDDKTPKVVHYEHENEYEHLRNTKYFTSCQKTTGIVTYDFDKINWRPRKGAKGSIINGFFGFFEVGRIDQSLNLGSLRVLTNRYKFVEQAPSTTDINYSKGYFDYQNGSDDISARLIKCITNIPMDLNYKELLNFNGGYLHFEIKDDRGGIDKSYLTLFYSDKSIQIEERD